MTEYVVLDFETANHAAHSACALAMVKVCHGEIEKEFYKLIRPLESNFQFTYLHGISWPQVALLPNFGEWWPQIQAFMADANFLVAHNASFDRRVLYACCQAYGLRPPGQPFLCTLKGARRGLSLPTYRLDSICRHLNIELEHHQALSDARAAARVLLHLHAQGLENWQMRLR